MKPFRRWGEIVLIVAAAVIGYEIAVAGRTASPPSQPADASTEVLLDWINASPGQRDELRSHDPTFARDLQSLRSELNTRRGLLAESLEDAQMPGEKIRERSESVIAASAALERRIIAYLLTVRDHLSAAQQRQLFGLCAETVRQGGGNQWRHGQRGNPWRGGPGRQRGGGGRPGSQASP